MYCSSSCSCGTARQQCANRPGKGGELDKQLGITSEDSDPEPDAEPEVEQDLFLINANGVCHDIKTRDLIGNGTLPKMGRFSPLIY